MLEHATKMAQMAEVGEVGEVGDMAEGRNSILEALGNIHRIPHWELTRLHAKELVRRRTSSL